MKYLRVYADDSGESHLEDGEFETREVELVEGAPPALFTNAFPVSEFQMFHLPQSDWEDKPHPAPRRQLVLILSGGIEIEAGDGSSDPATSCWQKTPWVKDTEQGVLAAKS